MQRDLKYLDNRWRAKSLASDPAAWQRFIDRDLVAAVSRGDADADRVESQNADPLRVRISTAFTNAKMPKAMATPPIPTCDDVLDSLGTTTKMRPSPNSNKTVHTLCFNNIFKQYI